MFSPINQLIKTETITFFLFFCFQRCILHGHPHRCDRMRPLPGGLRRQRAKLHPPKWLLLIGKLPNYLCGKMSFSSALKNTEKKNLLCVNQSPKKTQKSCKITQLIRKIKFKNNSRKSYFFFTTHYFIVSRMKKNQHPIDSAKALIVNKPTREAP